MGSGASSALAPGALLPSIYVAYNSKYMMEQVLPVLYRLVVAVLAVDPIEPIPEFIVTLLDFPGALSSHSRMPIAMNPGTALKFCRTNIDPLLMVRPACHSCTCNLAQSHILLLHLLVL